MGFIFDFSGKSIFFLGKLLPATSISTNAGLFLWTKLAEVLIIMSFGAGFRVKLSTVSSQLFKWLTITLFPRDDVRPVRNDELLILYAMVNKIKISPAQALVRQWLSNFKMTGPIECTSLITRIATRIGALEGNSIPFH